MTVSRGAAILSVGIAALLLSGLLLYRLPVHRAGGNLQTLERTLPPALGDALHGNFIRNSQAELFAYLGGRMREDLGQLVQVRWFSPVSQCSATPVQLNGEPFLLPGQPAPRRVYHWSEAGTSLALDLALRCGYRWTVFGLWAVLLVLSGAALRYFLPPPLSAQRRQWMRRLRQDGYSLVGAIEATAGIDRSAPLNPVQADCLENIYRPDVGNFEQALAVAGDGRVAALSAEQLPWLLQGLALEQGDLGRALVIATSPPRLCITLDGPQLRVHGAVIPMAKTPLMYYAWYAMLRRDGDGWYLNPRSNRSDREEGARLGRLMASHGGHSRAVDDLQNNGMRAKVLDQNRSKIKEELCAALGEALADPYLFESDRDPAGDRTRYRLKLPAGQIEIS